MYEDVVMSCSEPLITWFQSEKVVFQMMRQEIRVFICLGCGHEDDDDEDDDDVYSSVFPVHSQQMPCTAW